MYKFKTGDHYLTNTGDIFKITDVNVELMRMSVYNKGITVEFCYGTMQDAMIDSGWTELHIGIEFFEDREAKCLGQADGVVQVLYGSNLKSKLGQE